MRPSAAGPVGDRGDRRDGADSRPQPPGARGHRAVGHTADVIVEAWAPDREGCLEEVVAGAVASFADVGDAAATDHHRAELDAASDEDLVVELLSEVVYLLDARDVVVVRPAVAATGRGARLDCDLVAAAEVRLVGAVPKAVTYHRLSVGREADGTWRCRVVLDV